MTRCGATIAVVAAFSVFSSAFGDASCDVVFKDVAEHASIVLLVEYDTQEGGPARLVVREVIKGASDRESLRLGQHGLDSFGPDHGDRFLVALTPQHTLIKSAPGLGFCSPISVLKLKGDKLRGEERGNYDGGRSVIRLDQVRSELASRL